MSNCKCENVKIYDGKHRCMICYRQWMPATALESQDINKRIKMDWDNAAQVKTKTTG